MADLMFDDLPSFDDMPDAAAPSSAAAPPRFDDLPSFDEMPDGNAPGSAPGRPAPETALATGVREGAHAVVPGLGGLAGMGYGASIGGAIGNVPGAIIGGIIGGVAAGAGTGYVQEKALEAAGFDDAEQRAANELENPNSALAGQIAGGMVGMSPSAAASPLVKGAANQLIQRGAGAAFGGAVEAGHEAIEGDGFSAKKIVANAAAGAALPGVNKVGQKFVSAGESIPGRPNVARNPAAEPAHEAVGDTTAEIEVGDSSLAQSPPTVGEAQIETTGNPQSAPERSQRDYGKGKAPAGAEGDMLTQGHVAPDVTEALKATDVTLPIPGFDDHPSGVGQPAPQPRPVQSEEGLIEASRLQRQAVDQSQERAAAQNTGNPVFHEIGDQQMRDAETANTTQQYRDEGLPTMAPPKAQQAIARSKRLSMPKPEQPMDAAFPQAGEPLAVGANEATPVPDRSLPSQAEKAVTFTKIHEASDEGTDGRAMIYIAKDKTGNKIAAMMVSVKDGTASIEDISRPIGAGGSADKNAASNTLGPAVVRGLLRQFKEQNPDVKVLTGNRVSGARAKGQYDEMLENPVSVKMPAFKGETPINASVTEGQKAAGNYPKARTHDFGKPMKVETHAGDERTGTAPTGEKWANKADYDYGYYNKTIGKDKDHIDWARPPEGSEAAGDKHFVIDQKNLETGKFDEHKVFNYYKDEAAARQAYESGFSDGKGGERLGAIKEISRPELVKVLARHTSKPWNKPYSMVEEKAPAVNAAKPAAERAVIKDLIAKGKTTPEAIAALPPEQVEAAIAGKRTRKYGVGTGASAGYPVAGITQSDGRPVTANTKLKAQERSAIHKEMENWFAKSAPKENETNGQLLDRVKDIPPSSWVPAHKPASWMLAREAKRLLAKPTPAAVEKFKNAERLLRGAAEDVDNYRGGNRVEADISRSKRTGDEAVANAEAKNVDLGVNSAEDEMIARIDAKRGGKFDVPHEEAETMVKPKPVKTAADIRKPNDKTVDVSESSLARKSEAAKLAGKKSTVAAGTESEGAASKVKSKDIKTIDPAEKARIMEALNAATKKSASRDASLDITAPVDRESAGKGLKDLTGRFLSDESGKLDVGKIKSDIEAALKRTDHQSYISKKSAGPVDDYARSLSDDLHKLSQENRNHLIGALHKLSDLPKELNNKKVMEQIYHARDADSASIKLPAGQTGTHVDNLPPQIKKLYDEHLKEWFDQNDQFVKNIQAIDPDRIGPDVQHHISRITKGDTSAYNMLKSKDDPTSPQYNGISVNANAAKLRKFYALENAAGDRVVIQPEGNGFKIWRNQKLEKVKAPDFEFEDGGTFTVKTKDGKTIPFTMRQATTKEIEKNARGADGGKGPMRYYQNAGFSAAVTNVQLGAMARHLQELHRLSQTKEFQNLSTTNRATADERGWQQSNLPNFKGTYFHPEVLHVLNDFAGHLETPYSQLNSAITKLLFWMPTAHLANVGHHWVVGRGWDNFLPSGIKGFVTNTPKAIMSVIRQDEFQMQLRREGAGTIQGSVLTRDMMPKIAKALKMEIEEAPSKWGPIADKLGVPLQKLGSAVYDASSKVMWAGNDMFITQRVMELMNKGMSMKQAIIDAERDIPNYRLPTKLIMGGEKGRQIQQIASDPRILSFGRYHYGLMNSYANIVKDALGKNATAGDRLDAVGKMMAMGMLGLVVFPLMDMLQKKMTGNEGASQQRRGPISVPHHLAEAAEGKADVMAAVRATATIPPLYQTLLETLQNKDFRGKQIVEPGDFKNAVHGSPVAAGRVAAQTVGHAVRGLVSPINTLSNSTKKDVTPLGMLRDQATDAKNPSAKAVKYEKLIGMHNQRDTLQRFKGGGSDPLEAAYNKLFGYK